MRFFYFIWKDKYSMIDLCLHFSNSASILTMAFKNSLQK